MIRTLVSLLLLTFISMAQAENAGLRKILDSRGNATAFNPFSACWATTSSQWLWVGTVVNDNGLMVPKSWPMILMFLLLRERAAPSA